MKLIIKLGLVTLVLFTLKDFVPEKIFSTDKLSVENLRPKLDVEGIERRTSRELPIQISNEIRWDSFKLKRHLATYQFTFLELSRDQIDMIKLKGEYQRKLQFDVCKFDEVKEFRGKNVAMKFALYDRNGQYIEALYAEADNCRYLR